VVALDADDGSVRWRTYTVPAGHDGGPVWSTPAIDTETGRLYVGTGNAYHPPAADTTDAILALDSSTGAILGSFQAVKDDAFGPDNPAGPDYDFGASPNLFRAPDGTPLVGAGAKDGVYYAVERATMKRVWSASVGPGSAIGGFMGSTAYDGARIYGSNGLTADVAALGRDGSVQWRSSDGGSADFSPLATANGVLYTLNQASDLIMRDAATGTILRRISLGDQTWGGVTTVGGAVYVAIGIGPPPRPAPQRYGTGSIMAFGDTSRSGRPGTNPPPGTRPRIRVRVEPRSVRRVRRRTIFSFTTQTQSGLVVPGATVRFAGRRTTTDERGRARIVARLGRGKHPVRASKPGLRAGRSMVYVHRK